MIDRACISINSKCNLNCKYCHFSKKMNLSKIDNSIFLNKEIDKIIDNLNSYIKKNKILEFKLGIVGSGEPMLNFSTIKYIVESIKERELQQIVKLYTITNGTILTEEQLIYFFENKDIISLNFSLDGYKELHETMRTNFEKTMKNIKRYESLFQKKPRINCVVTKDTIVKQRKVIDFFVSNKFGAVDFSMIFGVDDMNLIITKKDYDSFIEACAKSGISTRQKSINEKIYDCTKYGRLCGVGKTNIFITKKGIYPCGRFLNNELYKLGEFDKSFFEIEKSFARFSNIEEGCCYYDVKNVEGEK